MSTLGDLLAEHTMLPGNAVDHLHAVVGEWQLLADLSFADYLMWVCRDDGVQVCVAQCRPTTAPTVLQTDAVGSVVPADRLPLVPETFASGTAYRECAADLVHMLADGTFPDVRDVAMSRSTPRVGDGFIRLDVDGVVAYASPNALSAYHRMGLTSELEGHNLIRITRPLISDS